MFNSIINTRNSAVLNLLQNHTLRNKVKVTNVNVSILRLSSEPEKIGFKLRIKLIISTFRYYLHIIQQNHAKTRKYTPIFKRQLAI